MEVPFQLVPLVFKPSTHPATQRSLQQITVEEAKLLQGWAGAGAELGSPGGGGEPELEQAFKG